jgi:uncharacterized membrane protein YhhN
MGSRGGTAKVGFGALALVDTILAGMSRPGARRLRHVTKPLLMPALTAAFAASTPGRRDGLRRGTLVAQAFSWGGDVALLNKSEGAFLAGVGSFFAAHVAYVGGFLAARDRDSDRSTLRAPGPRTAAVVWLLGAPVMAVAAGRKDPRFRVPIALYAGALTGMFAASTMLDRRLPADARRRVVIGTSLFLLSDSLLGAREFLLDDDSRVLGAAVMATYTTGQWLIADGVAATR